MATRRGTILGMATWCAIVGFGTGTMGRADARWEAASPLTDEPAVGDGDAIDDAVDNCPYSLGGTGGFNIRQLDTDRDGRGDTCDGFPVLPTPASFMRSDERMSAGRATSASLGDLDGDRDLDAFLTSSTSGRVYLNDGGGHFTDSGQAIGSDDQIEADLGDVDQDGDFDALVSVGGPPASELWLNDGTGHFTDSGQRLGSGDGVAFGDVDNDGDLDAHLADFAGPDTLWLNDGSGSFTDSGQRLGADRSNNAAFGDIDRDGDIDLVVAGDLNRVWRNDGFGSFAGAGPIGSGPGFAVALSDLDHDEDLDAFLTRIGGAPDEVWLNDGTGSFVDSGQRLGVTSEVDVALGDLDGDDDADAYVVTNAPPWYDLVWLNDGGGYFSDSGQRLGSGRGEGLDLGDVDRDGDLDALVADWGGPSEVWLNEVAASTPHGLLVAGGSAPPPGDRATVDLLEAAGIDVTVVDDDSDLSSIDATAYDLVLISSSVVPDKVGAAFVDATVPVLTWEAYLFDDLGMATPGETTRARTSLTVTQPLHPLASGLATGNHAVQAAGTMSYGAVGTAPGRSSDIDIVAHEPGRPDHAVLFAYQPGDRLLLGNGAAAGIRIGLFPAYSSELTPAGEDVLVGAAEWALAGGPPGNDDFADAFPIVRRSAVGWNMGATFEPGERVPSGTAPLRTSIWWVWTADRTSDVLISMADSGVDTTLAVWRGDAVDDLEFLASDTGEFDDTHLVLKAVVGEVYHLAVYMRSDIRGRVQLTVDALMTSVVDRGHVIDDADVAVGADGNPVLSSVHDRSFTVVQCADPACRIRTSNTLDTWPSPFGSADTTIAIGHDGLPVVSYNVPHDVVDGGITTVRHEIRIAHCDDPACTTASITAIDDGGGASGPNAIAIGADGLPVVVYRATGRIRVAHCTDAQCATSTSATIAIGDYPDIAIGADGLPVISYHSTPGDDLAIAICRSITCERVLNVVIDSAGRVGRHTSVAIADGVPIISYHDFSDDRVALAVCRDARCVRSSTMPIERESGTGPESSVSIGRDGFPVVAYTVAQELHIATCDDDGCGAVTRLGPFHPSNRPALTIGPDGTTYVSLPGTSRLSLAFR